MIRAHMATFPARAPILMQTVATILPQVDRLCICLNGYDAPPPELADDARIEWLIPDRDLKDAGKFAFPPAPDDMVFTIDDDILYPPDYVARTLAMFDILDPGRDVAGYLGHAWVAKPGAGRHGWRNYMFPKALAHVFKVDVLGTGTACQLGRNLPEPDRIAPAAGFVDLRHARLHVQAGRDLWVLPRPEEYLRDNLPEAMAESSLFRSVNRRRPAEMQRELAALMAGRSPGSGQRLEKIRRPERRAEREK